MRLRFMGRPGLDDAFLLQDMRFLRKIGVKSDANSAKVALKGGPLQEVDATGSVAREPGRTARDWGDIKSRTCTTQYNILKSIGGPRR
jgi:hypothetical protein